MIQVDVSPRVPLLSLSLSSTRKWNASLRIGWFVNTLCQATRNTWRNGKICQIARSYENEKTYFGSLMQQGGKRDEGVTWLGGGGCYTLSMLPHSQASDGPGDICTHPQAVYLTRARCLVVGIIQILRENSNIREKTPEARRKL